MPSTSVKKLHVAKSMQALESESKIDCNMKNRNTSSLVTSAKKVFTAAEKSHLDKDEETAYVQYSRFVELVLTLKSKPDFTKHSDRISLSKDANTAIGKAEQLKKSLCKRYSILEEMNCRAKNEKNDLISAMIQSDVIAPDVEGSPEPPESPICEEPVVEHSISSLKVFSILTSSQSNIIFMDTRSPKDFNESHIKYSRCINIPQDLLQPGTTAVSLESKLPPPSLGEWYNRGKADYIILIDWESKDETAQSNHLEVLKQAMSKWDLNCKLKRPPMILQGGYKDWMLKYPMHTTQAMNFNLANDLKTPSIITDVSGVEYPNLDEPDKSISTNKENLNGPGMLFTKSTVPTYISGGNMNGSSPNNRNSKSAPTVDRKSKPTIDRSSKSSVGDRKSIVNGSATTQNLSEANSLASLTSNSTLSSSSSFEKMNGEKDPERESQLVNLLNKESSLANESLKLAKEQLDKEREFETLRLKKGLEAEESKRIEIQRREEQLTETLMKLEKESQEKDKNFLAIKEDYAKLLRLLEEKDKKIGTKKEDDREFQRLKEKEILEAEKKRKAMQESVERLRAQRKKQELERRKRELSKADVIPREAVSANTGLKRNMSQQDQNNGQSSEYSIPLSRQSSVDSSSRGLVRSHSSPNIAQMVNQEENSQRKTPTVDRSLKPKAAPPSFQGARLRNLNPVYGNCPVRPATGLRNLGNTCFMNSVIQCLSNTPPLAEYFTSGQYVEDINRENKYGTGGEVAEEFAAVIRALWMGQYKSFYPKDFKNTVSKCLAVCIGNEQQDSHEFMVVLMEKLHADLNKKSIRPVPKLESCNDERSFWQHHKNYNSSKVSDIFEGLLKSTLTCMTCRTTSDSFEVFSCLSLPIMSYKCSLSDCLQHFLKSEKISGEAAWDCPKCKQKKEAEKKLRICRLPEILVIQLKRFSYEGLWRRKLQTNVEFDLLFNVPYEKNFEQSYRKYSLYGIVNHFGTLEGGHYTASCNASSKKWYKYDDHEVSEISSSDIQTSAAYLLFYKASDIFPNL